MTAGPRPRNRLWSSLVLLTAVTGLAAQADGEPPGDDHDDGTFGFSTPIACEEIRGYEDYKPLAKVELAPDEKLLVYFRPRHFKTSQVGDKHEAHLTQDVRIRRRGEKVVLWAKKNITDYQPREDAPPRFLYIRNTISLKILKPGEYDLDLVLHDRIGQGTEATRTLPFRVIPTPKPEAPKDDSPGAPPEG